MADVRVKAYSVAAAIFALDRLTKWLVEQHISFTDTYRVIPGFFDIVRSQNRGAAFGILNQPDADWRTSALVLLSGVAVIVIGVMLWNAHRLDRLSLWALVLILGGAAGNEFDRLVYGQVTDFLELYVGQYHWPTFNVADSAIVIGSGLFVIELLRTKRQAANVP